MDSKTLCNATEHLPVKTRKPLTAPPPSLERRNSAPDKRLGAFCLMVAALLALSGALALPATAQTPPTCTLNTGDLWCSVITVVENNDYYGYHSSHSLSYGELSSNSFMVGTSRYTIDTLSVAGSSKEDAGNLTLDLTERPSAAEQEALDRLVLHLDDDAFRLIDRKAGPPGFFYWEDSDLDWSGKDYVIARLREIPPEVTLHLSEDRLRENTGIVTVTATVSPASSEVFTVEISANPVAPATDDDFELSTNRTLSFAPNATGSTGTVEISPVDDDNPEPDDVVTVSGVVSNAAIPDPDDVTFTIINDDTTAMRNVRVVSGPGPDRVWSAGELVELEVSYSLPVVVERPSSYYDCWSYYDDGTCRPPGPFVVVVFRSDARPGYGEVLSVALVPYVSGSGTDTLRFAYTVGADEDGARGVWVVADDGMLLRGATIRPLRGGDVELSEYTLTRVRRVTVRKPSGGAWTEDDTVRVTVIFAGRSYTPPKNLNEVYVNDKGGTPSVDLLLGDSERRGLARTARYKRGSGSNTLTFEYEVTAGDGQVSAVEVVANSLARNGATIRNKRGYDAGLHHLGVPWYSPPPLQVRFVSWPKRHDGRKQVDVRVAFSEPVERSPEEVGEYGVRVGGGEVTSVREVDDRENELEDREVAWEFEIEPDSDELLTVSLEAGRPCEEAGAICTPDGRALSEGIWTMVRGPDEDVELTEPDDETPAPTENVVPPGPEDDETIDTTDTESDFRESPDSEEYLEIPAAGGGCAIASAGHVSGNALRNTVFSLFLTAAVLLVSGGGKRYLKP